MPLKPLNINDAFKDIPNGEFSNISDLHWERKRFDYLNIRYCEAEREYDELERKYNEWIEAFKNDSPVIVLNKLRELERKNEELNIKNKDLLKKKCKDNYGLKEEQIEKLKKRSEELKNFQLEQQLGKATDRAVSFAQERLDKVKTKLKQQITQNVPNNTDAHNDLEELCEAFSELFSLEQLTQQGVPPSSPRGDN